MAFKIMIDNENQLSCFIVDEVYFVESGAHERFRILKEQCGFGLECAAILTYVTHAGLGQEGETKSLEINAGNTVIIDEMLIYGEPKDVTLNS